MRCPACKHELVVVEREGIEVDWCVHCHGIWFDVGELELLAEKAGIDIDHGLIGKMAVSKEARRRCPRCRRKMEKASPESDASLLLDRCPRHGLWFDAGELGALLRGLEKDAAGAAVLGFLGETFVHGSVGKGTVSSQESDT